MDTIDVTPVNRLSAYELIKSYVNLTKPRINILLIFTAYMAAIVAIGGIPSLKTSLVLIIGLGLSDAACIPRTHN